MIKRLTINNMEQVHCPHGVLSLQSFTQTLRVLSVATNSTRNVWHFLDRPAEIQQLPQYRHLPRLL